MKQISVLIFSILVFTSCTSTQNITSSNKKGESFKNAIVVKSITEEYKYIQDNCFKCKPISQSLVFKKKKPYDVIKVKKSNGTIVFYFFNISSFFGKGF